MDIKAVFSSDYLPLALRYQKKDWDSEINCYSYVFDHGGNRYMFIAEIVMVKQAFALLYQNWSNIKSLINLLLQVKN